MKRKIALTVLLGITCVATTILAFRTYSDIGAKLDLNTNSQSTMVVKELEKEVENSEVEEPETTVEATVEPTETPAELSPEPTEEVNPEAAVLTLKSNEVEITAGTKFHVVPQVENITDDKDSRSRLFQNIEVFGEYDRNTPGKYELEYVVTDSDGNQSVPQILTLIVKEK